jgi:hypothetical protein
MTFITANNGTTNLASAITSAATSITVTTGQGARFPAVVAPDVMMLTLDDGNNVEIIKCTAHTAATDVFTIIRAAELYQTTGSLSYAFAATGSGTQVEARFTKGMEENTEPIRLLQQNLPVTVAAPSGSLMLYARGLAGRAMMKFMGPAGVDYLVQEGIFDSQIVAWRPGTVISAPNVTTGSAYGANMVVYANATTPGSAVQMGPSATGSLSGSMRALRLVTGAASGSAMRFRAGPPTSGSGFVSRGWAPGIGGFFFFSRVWMPSGSSLGGRCFIGLTMDTGSTQQSVGGSPANNVCRFGFDAQGQPTNSIGVGYMETGSLNGVGAGGYASLRVGMFGTGSASNAASFTQVLMTDTSHSIGDNILDIYMYCKPFDDNIQIRIDKNNSDGSITTLHDRKYTNNTYSLPVASAWLTPCVEIQSTTANSCSIHLMSMYLSSDY